MDMSDLSYQEQLAQAQAIGIPEQIKELQYGTLAEQHEQVDLLEEAMYSSLDVLELEPIHKFISGMYVRELFIPAGTLITSYIHKTPHVCILSQGTISVWTVGGPTVTVSAPYAFISEAGTRRVGYALEDTIWTTVHQTDKTDINEIEEEIFIKGEHPRDRLARRLKESPCQVLP